MRFNNGQYYKEDQTTYNEATGDTTVNFVANKKLMKDYLADESRIAPEDFEVAEKVRAHFQGVSFKVLRNDRISDYERLCYDISQAPVLSGPYHLAVAASMPSAYERAMTRAGVNVRIHGASGGNVGNVGEKVEIEIEVLRTIYSDNYGTYIVTGITKQDQTVYFFCARKMEVGKTLNIRGRVKKHDANSTTKLSHVKVI